MDVFKRIINNISYDKTETWLRKRNFKRETEPFLIAAQNNAIRTNHIRARIDNTRCDWIDKVIHWEMCNRLKFDHTNKWYMHNPASVLENDTHKLQWDFDI